MKIFTPILSFFIFWLGLAAYCSAQEIAITFDDAPTGNGPLFSGIERSEKILGHLKKHDVDEAAFFVVTRAIDQSGKDRLMAYTRAGHLLANHTHTHEWIRDMGTEKYIDGIRKADSTLRLLPGYFPYFRFPFLDEGKSRPTRDSIRQALRAMNVNHGYVTIDNYDWYINHLLKQAITDNKKANMEKLKALYIDHIWSSIRFYDNIAKKHLGRSPRHVLLLHENDMAASFLGDLISHIKKQGWKIIPVSEAYKDPIASTIPDVLFNGQGRVASIANSKGVPPRELVQESEDELFLETQVKEKEIFK
jgi:peptidoglycan-N-acetylglucosamine deacetylase